MARFLMVGLAFSMLGLVMAIGLFVSEARGHNGYPPACCGGKDCAPAEWVRRSEDGGYLVKTRHGIMKFGPAVKILPSFDGKTHGCLYLKSFIAPGVHQGRCLLMGGFV